MAPDGVPGILASTTQRPADERSPTVAYILTAQVLLIAFFLALAAIVVGDFGTSRPR